MKRILGGFIILGMVLAYACDGGDDDASTITVERVENVPSGDSVGRPIDRSSIQTSQSGITVVGIGRVELEPDVALISLGVGSGDNIFSSSGFPSLQIIKEEELQPVVDVLKDNGVGEDDIYVSTFSASILSSFGEGGAQIAFTWDKPRDVDTIIEKVRDTLREETDYSLQGISVVFSREDCADAEREAQEAALEDARTRAEQLAELSDLSLGAITSVSEVPGGSSVAVFGFGGALASGCLDIEEVSALSGYPPGGINTPSEINVSSQLYVTFAAE